MGHCLKRKNSGNGANFRAREKLARTVKKYTWWLFADKRGLASMTRAKGKRFS